MTRTTRITAIVAFTTATGAMIAYMAVRHQGEQPSRPVRHTTAQLLTTAPPPASTIAPAPSIAAEKALGEPVQEKPAAAVASHDTSDAGIEAAVRAAAIPVRNLTARNIGGIVILRGSADHNTSERAAILVKSMGVTRLANLITTTAVIDDEGIRRDAERHLATNRALDGCELHVSCNSGVIRVSGKVQNELQIDAARSSLHGVQGAQGIQLALSKI